MTQKRINDYKKLKESQIEQKLDKQNLEKKTKYSSLLDGQNIIE